MDMGESTELESMRYATIYPKMIELGMLVFKSGPTFRLVDTNLDEMMAKVKYMINSRKSAQEVEVISIAAILVKRK